MQQRSGRSSRSADREPGAAGRSALRNVVFAAPPDDPRARRPVDAALVVLTWAIVVLLAWAHRARDPAEVELLELFARHSPAWLRGVAGVAFSFAGLYVVGLIGGIAFGTAGRWPIVRDALAAIGIAVAGLIVGAYLGGPEFPDFFPDVLGREGYPSYPVPRLAMVVAATGVLRPYLAAPMRKVSDRVAVTMTLSALVLAHGTTTAVLGGVALGMAGASTVRVVFGSGRGIPSRARIMSALDEAGADVVDIEFATPQPIGATLVRGSRSDGSEVLIRVYGRDATDAAFAERLWRSIWYRDSSRSVWSNREQLAEHEALAMLAFEREEVPARRLLTSARAATDDIVIVSEPLAGRTLEELDADATDEDLDRAWGALDTVHAAGFAHSAIDRSVVVVTDDDVVFDDLVAVDLLADDRTRRTDEAQLLVATSLCVGIDRALAAAHRHLDPTRLAALLPLLQSPVLSRQLQGDVKRHHFPMRDLRHRLADALDVEQPELEQLRRVSWGGVAMIALTLFAAYSLITSLTEIGIDTIVDEIARANWNWIAVAFVVSQLPGIGDYVGFLGATGRSVPFGPTMMFRYAMLYISLAVPGDAGAIAMNVRYQQKLGVTPAAAIAQGPLLTIVSKIVDVILLLITARFVARTIDTSEVDFGPVVRMILLIAALIVLAIVVVLAVPKWRSKVLPHVREGATAAAGIVTEPERLTKVVVGTLITKVLFAIALSASVAAYGADLSFAGAIFVNTIVSIFVGLVPIPGGIGVGEAALTAGLISAGVPEQAAVAAAITHRLLTTYLPPVFGWWASRWLSDRDYL